MMGEPKFMKEGYAYLDDETEEWRIKDNAPDWAKREFEEFFNLANSKEDENGVVTKY